MLKHFNGVNVGHTLLEIFRQLLHLRLIRIRTIVLDQTWVNKLKHQYTNSVKVMGEADAFTAVIDPVLLSSRSFSIKDKHLGRHSVHSASWN